MLKKLMDHASAALGLSLREAPDSSRPRAGEFVHFASRDLGAPRGTLRVFSDEQELRRMYAALHGQSIQVGADHVGISVHNDNLYPDVHMAISGNGSGGR